MFLPPPRTVRRAALLLIILGLKAFSASGQTEPFKDEDEPLEGRTEQCFRAMSLFDNSTGLKDIVNLVLQGSNSGEMSSTSGSGSSSAAIVRNGNSSENEQFNNVTTIASEVEDVEDGIRVVPLFVAYSDSDVVLEWKNVTEKGNLTLLEHEFKFSYSNTEEEVFRSNYSALSITVTLQRKISNKLAGVYIPALLIVIITFSTFWLGPHSLPDRVSIGITAFLAIVTMFSQARLQLPPISYVSNPVERVAKGRKCRTRSTLGDQLEVTSTESDDDGEDSDQGDDQCCKCCGLFRVDIASSDPAYGSMKMDSLSRVFVPLAFALFCAYYWPSLLKNA
ncbi:Gamma-aminobutyric acid receptor subunit gamma-1 [Halotydeus destructor]|nr:Gamma-aminobutyric acid receptor subunit gamma-1 [Halotydeus destructor]